ncbi:small ribosomal subunit protein mS22-like [Babylonia areolata]|uniref:small ribosomal subunit protein mS22-like n=1 Tax=Babylonia areolata TaxID=304850 RepID=UPI003FD20CAE
MAAPMKLTRFALRSILRGNHGLRSCSYCTSSSNFSGGSADASRDPMPVFMQEEVQSLLKKMTGFDILKLAGPQKVALRKPKYKLLTDEELAEMQQKAERRMKYRLQIPPFMKVREPIRHTLSHDPDLAGLDSSKYIFTDITFGIKDRQRVIVVREPDGTLRHADWEERDRMNQIYSPVPGRQMEMSKMFQEEHLEAIFKKGKYAYLLDMACVQFEPDHPDYIRVCHRTFEVIDSKHHYDELRSTRHFASMAFYYVWYKKVDYLLIDMVNRDLISDAGDLIRLYCIVHPDSAITQQLKAQPSEDVLGTVKAFCSTEATHKGQLELAVQGYEEKQRASASAARS